jgi:hypothetical protein
MKMHSIEIDEKIWNYLKQHAEPFVDTPNSVLTRLLFDRENEEDGEDGSIFKIPSVSVKGSPKSLAQIFEVVYEMEVNGYTRIQATNRVAKKRGTAPQTITDKFCRQLNKRAHEIDELLNEPGYGKFRELLKNKFSDQEGVIDTYFDSLIMSGAC